MSSSEEDDVRRSRRSDDASHGHSPYPSEEGHQSTLPNGSANSLRDSDGAELNSDDDADLFGSGSDKEEPERYSLHLPTSIYPAVADFHTRRPRRTLDDEELDSGDDEGHYGRTGAPLDEEDGGTAYGETLNVMDLSLSRAPEPQSSNGEVGACSRERKHGFCNT
jgi:RNA polymerase-associated protein LEO1